MGACYEVKYVLNYHGAASLAQFNWFVCRVVCAGMVGATSSEGFLFISTDCMDRHPPMSLTNGELWRSS